MLTQRLGGLERAQVHAGGCARAPGTLPAHRSLPDGPAAALIITTAKQGRFFQEIGRPAAVAPPEPQRAVQLAEGRHQVRVHAGTPEQNAAAGIELPTFSG